MDNPWIGLTFAVLIGFLWIITAQFTAQKTVYLAALAILGAVFPPLGFGFGVLAVIMIVLTHPAIFTGSLPQTWQQTNTTLKGTQQ